MVCPGIYPIQESMRIAKKLYIKGLSQHPNNILLETKDDDNWGCLEFRSPNICTYTLVSYSLFSLCNLPCKFLKICGRCRRVGYCSVIHLHEHWNVHQKFCKFLERTFDYSYQGESSVLAGVTVSHKHGQHALCVGKWKTAPRSQLQ